MTGIPALLRAFHTQALAYDHVSESRRSIQTRFEGADAAW